MVNLIDCDIDEFVARTQTKKMFFFGAGVASKMACQVFSEYELEKQVCKIIDNDERKVGTNFKLLTKEVEVISFEQFADKVDVWNAAVMIMNVYYVDQIIRQMDREIKLDGLDCYIERVIEEYPTPGNVKAPKRLTDIKIPKKIHYCWFGGNPMPDFLKKCIGSWQKVCPEYEIIRWDENNYDISKNRYMEQAYKAKKWGLVSDYARLDIVYNEGGIYLDTDVELLKPLDDLLYDNMFCATYARRSVTAIIGAVRKHGMIKELRDDYDRQTLLDGEGNAVMLPCNWYQDPIFRRHGFRMNNQYQNIDGKVLYPTEVFHPYDTYRIKPNFTENTYAIHHASLTWRSEEERTRVKTLGEWLKKRFDYQNN